MVTHGESESSGQHTVMTEERMTDDLIATARGFDERARSLVTRRKVALEERLGRPIRTFLEVGCGTGDMAEHWEALDVDYVGVDIDRRMVERGRELQRRVHVADVMERFDGDDRQFDCVSACQVLEHLVQPKDFMERVRDLTHGRGALHVDVPNHDGLSSALSKVVNLDGDRYGALEFPHHSFSYTADALKKLLSIADSSEAFACTSDDPLWGQVRATSSNYYKLARLLKKENLLVGIAIFNGRMN